MYSSCFHTHNRSLCADGSYRMQAGRHTPSPSSSIPTPVPNRQCSQPHQSLPLAPFKRLSATQLAPTRILAKVCETPSTPHELKLPLLTFFFFFFFKYSLLLFSPSEGTMRSPPEAREDSEEGKLICQPRRAQED
ncbi:hypothetical protein L211DRAFT_578194 [Terfezia boudieri ATCC MYA-4762]|uniref:Uncharacterized protein n=1 Tax=Terfezia boudieri ATCC MYA-4762 TaxID=1051890 RepID=A0A3N4LEW1_9PEZI|nr:hypothetical protein L211DRAFT_578194 [Terfezia boudieri ATCC MYA-4762]